MLRKMPKRLGGICTRADRCFSNARTAHICTMYVILLRQRVRSRATRNGTGCEEEASKGMEGRAASSGAGSERGLWGAHVEVRCFGSSARARVAHDGWARHSAVRSLDGGGQRVMTRSRRLVCDGRCGGSVATALGAGISRAGGRRAAGQSSAGRRPAAVLEHCSAGVQGVVAQSSECARR